MRKVRDFDAEPRELEQRAKQLRQKKIQQFGELVEATGADALPPDQLAGAMLAAVAEKSEGAITAWTASGARFFRETARKSSRRSPANRQGSKAASAGSPSA